MINNIQLELFKNTKPARGFYPLISAEHIWVRPSYSLLPPHMRAPASFEIRYRASERKRKRLEHMLLANELHSFRLRFPTYTATFKGQHTSYRCDLEHGVYVSAFRVIGAVTAKATCQRCWCSRRVCNCGSCFSRGLCHSCRKTADIAAVYSGPANLR